MKGNVVSAALVIALAAMPAAPRAAHARWWNWSLGSPVDFLAVDSRGALWVLLGTYLNRYDGVGGWIGWAPGHGLPPFPGKIYVDRADVNTRTAGSAPIGSGAKR